MFQIMENLLPWFQLKSTPGVGNLIFKRLIDAFDSAEAVLGAPHQVLTQIDGVSERLATAIKQTRLPDSVETELDRVHQKGFRVVTLVDSDYPALLLEIPDPPPYLYVYGRLPRNLNNIAIVGSRHATQYGLSTTKHLSRDLVKHGLTIISGMARGIDTAAHEGALAAGGKTVAVLGSGLAYIYPRENEKLFHQIAENGAVITEFPLDAEPEGHHFPMRNRIISGLSLGTVIVEATLRSGSLITARLAAEQNREVFAVPGSIKSFKSTGTHTLIKQGARLVEQSQDILDEIVHLLDRSDTVSDSDEKIDPIGANKISATETSVLQVLEPYPIHFDDLVRKLVMPPSELAAVLLRLELTNKVQQDPGKYFYLK
jgi:DNA processing protein